MAFLPIKDKHIKLIKRGKILVHETVSKGKKYYRGKIYLRNSNDVGSIYQLYEVENIRILSKSKQHRKGKGFILFVPK